MSKLRISLTEQGEEIKGQVRLDGPMYFALECLALAIDTLAKSSKVDPVEFARDLYFVVKENQEN